MRPTTIRTANSRERIGRLSGSSFSCQFLCCFTRSSRRCTSGSDDYPTAAASRPPRMGSAPSQRGGRRSDGTSPAAGLCCTQLLDPASPKSWDGGTYAVLCMQTIGRRSWPENFTGQPVGGMSLSCSAISNNGIGCPEQRMSIGKFRPAIAANVAGPIRQGHHSLLQRLGACQLGIYGLTPE